MEIVAVLAAALVFYALTLAPTVVWGDSAAISLASLHGSVRLGTAGDHPLFILVAHFFTLFPGDPARNVNFASAMFGALTVALVYRCARQLTAGRLPAVIGAASLCVSHAFWLHSVIAEVYTANAFFLTATLTLLLDWHQRRQGRWLAAAGTVFVVGLTNHVALASAGPAAAIFVAATLGRRVLSRRTAAAVGVAGLLSAWLALTPRTPIAGLLRSLWVGPPGLSEYLWPPDPALLPNELGYYVLFRVYQFPTISLALGFLGTLTLLGTQRSVATLLLGIVVVNGGTFVAHTVWPSATSAKYVFYIPDYVVFSLLCAIGTDRAMRQVAGRQPGGPLAFGLAAFALAAILPPLLYAAAPSTVKALGLDLVRASELPYRDSNRFFLNPSKRGDDGARRFGREALDTVKPRAVIFADYTPYTVLSYLQIVEGRRPDVLLQSAPSFGQAVPVRWVIDDGHRRPTYVATLTPGYYDLHGLGDHEFVPAGPIFEVHPR